MAVAYRYMISGAAVEVTHHPTTQLLYFPHIKRTIIWSKEPTHNKIRTFYSWIYF